jgi:hypothetical protein
VKHFLDNTRYQYTVTKGAEQKLDQNGKQKYTREGAPMWQTQIQALDEDGATVLMVTTAGEKPTVTVGQLVTPFGLEAIPWNTNGKNGVAYRAEQIKPVAVSASK